MDFSFDHRFDAPVDAVAEALLDEDYQRSLDGIRPLKKRQVIEQVEEDGGRVVRRTRCVLGTDLGAAKRFLGEAEPAWVEEATWDPGRGKWDWVILPEVAADLLTSMGSIELHDAGDTTIRRVRGVVKVRVPLYGGKVERVIVNGLEEAYAQEATRLAKWLAG
ncbi:MAG: DUF2505 domain-containing protein [Actinomycetota bacterium]|nr:DUF2505 domain-containing protein [Actinomycetota bacterium]